MRIKWQGRIETPDVPVGGVHIGDAVQVSDAHIAVHPVLPVVNAFCGVWTSPSRLREKLEPRRRTEAH